MPAAVNFADPRFRRSFQKDRGELDAAIQRCVDLDKRLDDKIKVLFEARERGASNLAVRMTEQLISNRGQLAQLLKQKTAIKKDVVDREIRLADREAEAEALQGASAVGAGLLAWLQDTILGGSGRPGLASQPAPEPRGGAQDAARADRAIERRLAAAGGPAAEPEAPDAEIPTELAAGDVVSDPDGNLWRMLEEGCEPLGERAAAVHLEPGGGAPAYAELAGGGFALVVDVSPPDEG